MIPSPRLLALVLLLTPAARAENAPSRAFVVPPPAKGDPLTDKSPYRLAIADSFGLKAAELRVEAAGQPGVFMVDRRLISFRLITESPAGLRDRLQIADITEGYERIFGRVFDLDWNDPTPFPLTDGPRSKEHKHYILEIKDGKVLFRRIPTPAADPKSSSVSIPLAELASQRRKRAEHAPLLEVGKSSLASVAQYTDQFCWQQLDAKKPGDVLFLTCTGKLPPKTYPPSR